MGNKIAVYTCITGNYDSLRKHRNSRNPDIDFICFTDNPNLLFNDNGWTIKPIPQDLLGLSKIKQQRLVKILPHRYLKGYDLSLWVDGNIEIRCDVDDFLKSLDFEKFHFYTRKHPSRDCVYEEAKSILGFGKDSPKIVNPQIEEYRKEGYPEHFGLAETCIIARKHNEVDCQILDNKWASELTGKSHRDQLSFDYSRWKTETEVGYFTLRRLNKDDKFRWRRHGEQAKSDDSDDELDVVNVVFLTHNRTKVANECLKSLVKHIKYPELRWIISDDRSDEGHVDTLTTTLKSLGVSDYVVTRTDDTNFGLGSSMNNGLKEGFKVSDIVLTVEDDWMLQKDLILTGFVKELSRSSASMIRLATVVHAKCVGSRHSGYWKVVPCIENSNYDSVFNNQVALRHKRIYDKIGYYKDSCHSDVSERDMINRYNKFSLYGNLKDYEVLFPRSLKPGTYDDKSLYFIHVGKSSVGHRTNVPKRFESLNDDVKTNTNACVWIVDDRELGNVMCLASIESARKFIKRSDVVVLCSKTNGFIKEYEKRGAHVVFIDDEIVKIQHRLEQVCYKNEDWTFNKNRIGSYTYLRFLLFKDEFLREYESFIYIDIDTIVIRDFEIALMNLAKKTGNLVVVKELDGGSLSRLNRQCQDRSIRISCSGYFNSGVFSFNRTQLNKKMTDISDRLFDMIKYNFALSDQDIMNVAFNDHKTFAEWKYNMSTFTNGNFRKYYGQGSIIHYCGSKAKTCMLDLIVKNKKKFSPEVVEHVERLRNGK